MTATTLSSAGVCKRITRIVGQYRTDEAKQQFAEEQAWRQENEHNNQRSRKKARRAVADQIPVLLKLRTEGLGELWGVVKGNKRDVYRNEYCHRTNSPCWEWVVPLNTGQRGTRPPFSQKQGYGYIGLLGLGKAALCITHLALWSTMGETLIRRPPTRSRVVSHLCHWPPCFNPNHLCQETRDENLSRDGCVAFGDPGCQVRSCNHEPQCIVAHSPSPFRVQDGNTPAVRAAIAAHIRQSSVDSSVMASRGTFHPQKTVKRAREDSEERDFEDESEEVREVVDLVDGNEADDDLFDI